MTHTHLLAFITVIMGSIVLFSIAMFFLVKQIVDLFKKIKFESKYSSLRINDKQSSGNNFKKVISEDQVQYKDQVFSYKLEKPLNIKNIKGYEWLDNSTKEYENIKAKSSKVVNVRTQNKDIEQLPFNF